MIGGYEGAVQDKCSHSIIRDDKCVACGDYLEVFTYAEKSDPRKSALDIQVAGDHYKDMKIQPFEFAMANNFNAGQFSVLKYISRYKKKNGLEDLKKAKHFLDMLIELEYSPNRKE